MAKAKSKTVDPKKTKVGGFTPPAKPATVKPLGKSQRPAKKSAALPAAAKIVPKVIKPGHSMTAKKLKGITDKKGVSTFLLKYPLEFFIREGSEPKKEIEADIMRMVAIDGHYADETTYEVADHKKQEITLLVKTKIKPHQDPPPPVAATPEPPFTPADPVISPADMLNSATPPKIDHSVVGDPEPKPEDEPVKATARLDQDADSEVNFDCTPWLLAATDQDLVTLADDEWAHSDMADQVAKFCAAHSDKLKDLIGGLSEGDLDMRLSVEVDAGQATEWIKKFRPDVYEFVAEKNEENNEYLHENSGLLVTGKR